MNIYDMMRQSGTVDRDKNNRDIQNPMQIQGNQNMYGFNSQQAPQASEYVSAYGRGQQQQIPQGSQFNIGNQQQDQGQDMMSMGNWFKSMY